jgi:hypothetical protein
VASWLLRSLLIPRRLVSVGRSAGVELWTPRDTQLATAASVSKNVARSHGTVKSRISNSDEMDGGGWSARLSGLLLHYSSGGRSRSIVDINGDRERQGNNCEQKKETQGESQERQITVDIHAIDLHGSSRFVP